MKRLFIALLLLLSLVSTVAAQDSWIYNSEYLVLKSEITGQMRIVKASPKSSVDFVMLNLSFFPLQTPHQQIVDAAYTPSPIGEGEALSFRWDTPSTTELHFSVKHTVRRENDFVKINRKVRFPIRNVPLGYEIYLRPQKIIDSDDERIERLASEIVQGEDDLYLAVHKLAAWTVNNIQYNLSTVTAKASKPATWVLENRQGVCDELTSLFIAMARSVGIPARFVSGISYTNAPFFEQKWGPHGWAEVYFPGYGWVPFDITYEEFGFTDPTHIVTKYSLDAGETSLEYAWRGKQIDLATEELTITAETDQVGPRKAPDVDLEIAVLKEKTGLGGYNAVEVTVKNLRNYYQSVAVAISKTSKLNTHGERKQYLALQPGEEQRIFWIVELDEELDEGFLYTFPLTVYTERNVSRQVEFTASEHNHLYSLQEMQSLVQQRTMEKQKTYSSNVQIQCILDKEEYYIYEKPNVTCSMKNVGNTLLDNLHICLEADCVDKTIGINQEKNISFTIYNIQPGFQEAKLTISNDKVSKLLYVEYKVLDEPKIALNDITYPPQVEFGEEFTVKFFLEKVSLSKPQNVRVTFGNKGLEEKFYSEQVETGIFYTVNMNGADLQEGENVLKIHVTYEDKKQKTYEVSDTLTITLPEVTFPQRVQMLLRSIMRSITGIFS